MQNDRQNAQNLNGFAYFKCVMFSCLFGIAVMLALFLVSHFVVMSASVPLRVIEPIILVIGIIGSFVSGYISSRLIKKNGLLVGALCGLIIFLVMAISNFTVTGEMGILMLIKFIAIVCSASIGGIIGVNKRKKRK